MVILRRENNLKLKYFFVFLFIILFGKAFYACYGWKGHLHPLAPLEVIIAKDFIIIAFMSYLLISTFMKNYFKVNIFLHYYFLFILLVLIISVLHLHNLPFAAWSQHYLRNSIFYSIFVVFGYSLIPFSKFKTVFKLIVSVGIINSIFSIIVWKFFPSMEFNGRAIGFTDNPITLAGLLSFSFIIFYIYLTNGKLMRLRTFLKYLFLLVLISIGIGLTSSITHLLSLLFFIFIYSLINLKRKIYMKRFLSLGLFFLLIIFFLYYHTPLFLDFNNKVANLLQNPGNINSVKVHLENYIFGFNYLLSKDIANILFGSFELGRYMKFDSAYLVILYNFGLILFIIISVFLIFLLIKSLKLRKKIKNSGYLKIFDILFFSLVTTLFSGLMFNVFNRFPLNCLFYLELGMLIRLIFLHKKTLSE